MTFFSKRTINNIIYLYSRDNNPSIENVDKQYTRPSLLSDDIFDQLDELFEGSDDDKLKAYEILVNLNEEVSFLNFFSN